MSRKFLSLFLSSLLFLNVITSTTSHLNLRHLDGYPNWSSDNKAYKLGDLVQYQGKVYECTYAHNSNVAWTPTEAQTLWKVRDDLKAGEGSGGDGGDQGGKDDQGGKEDQGGNYTPSGSAPKRLVTGYWHNFLNGSTALKIKDVPKYYNLICVAFANASTKAGEVTFSVNSDLANAVGGYTDSEFIEDIKNAKKNGQHVIISVGGAEGTTMITDQTSANNFQSSLITMIDKFGFEGVDIDFEGASVSGTDYIAGALRKVHDHFGNDFMITMAPETYYMQADRGEAKDITTAYWRLAMSLKDILTVVHPQFYNSGTMIGYGGVVASYPSADFITSLASLYIESGLRPEQLAFGVPCTPSAAGSGYLSPADLKKAIESMVYGTSSGAFTPPKKYPAIRGVMTWSINWDGTKDYAWAKAMKQVMDSLS